MAWLNRVMLMLLSGLRRMERWAALASLGRSWSRLSAGGFDEQVGC